MSRIAALIMGVTACFALEWARRGTQVLVEHLAPTRARGGVDWSPYSVLAVVWSVCAVLALWASHR
jgi:hypothetical protein